MRLLLPNYKVLFKDLPSQRTSIAGFFQVDKVSWCHAPQLAHRLLIDIKCSVMCYTDAGEICHM